MARGKIGIAGFELSIVANKAGCALTASVRNRLWRGVHAGLKRLLSRRRHFAEGQRSVPADAPVDATPEAREILRRIEGVQWYHSIDLGHGIVTPGEFDHRPLLHRYRLPTRLDGLRVLDIGTWDGFWAFEFERRGAAEVVATDVARRSDVDLTGVLRAGLDSSQLAAPTGRGFALAKEILGSSVRRETVNVYDLSPERLGTFDIVHIGDILVHLRDPVRALERVLAVTRGYALVSDVYFPDLDCAGGATLAEYGGGGLVPVWWRLSFSALESMIRDAGFGEVECLSRFRYGVASERGSLMHHAVFRARPGSAAAPVVVP